MQAGKHFIITRSPKLGDTSGKLITMKNNLRFIHAGRRITNWRKPINSQLVNYPHLGLASCTPSLWNR